MDMNSATPRQARSRTNSPKQSVNTTFTAFTATTVVTGPVMVPIDSSPKIERILLAEDNIVNQKVAMNMIKRFGYHVTVASNGQIALNTYMTGNERRIIIKYWKLQVGAFRLPILQQMKL